MKAIDIERHFPWYVDSSDTDNLDCQCGARCDGIAGWATHTVKETSVSFIKAAKQFVHTWSDQHLADNIAKGLRCKEVEALADMLSAFGACAAGGTWIEAHSYGDECGDMHCRCDDCDGA